MCATTTTTYYADKYFDGVGLFPESTVPQKIQGVPEKHSYYVHKMQEAFAQIKRCHVLGNVS